MADRSVETLLVVAGSHMTACLSLREQVLAAAPQLHEAGVHVPGCYDRRPRTWHNLAWELGEDRRHDPGLGTLAGVAVKAATSGASTLLLLSEEFEHPLRQSRSVTRLDDLATALGAKIRVLVVLRHQVPYLNLVHAIRAVQGNHGWWFEDFVLDPQPGGQFSYPEVVGALSASPAVELTVLDFASVVDAGGLPALLAAGELDVELADLPDLAPEETPDAGMVDGAIMARRVLRARGGSDGQGPSKVAVRQLAAVVRAEQPDLGPYWGWTPELLAATAARYHRDNERLHDQTGVALAPPADRATNRFVVREATGHEIGALVDGLRTAIDPGQSQD